VIKRPTQSLVPDPSKRFNNKKPINIPNID
jgi:hypothetical protein